jgi:hypothetical protein
LDQTLGWTSKHLSRWYRQPPVTLRQEEMRIAASLVWLLRGDAMQRAISAWHLGWKPAQEASGNQWQAPFLSRLLEDPYSAVRYQAIKALQGLPGFTEFEADFIGSASELKAAQARAVETWGQSRGDPSRDDRAQILLGDDYEVLEEIVTRLLSHRDDSYVRIPE